MDLVTVYNISLDVAKTNYVTIKAKQQDQNSRRIVIHCTNNGKEYNLTNDVQAIAQMRKPDGTVVAVNCQIDVPNNNVIVDMTYQMLVEDGVIDAEVILIQSATKKVLSSMIFHIIVIGSIITTEEIHSADEFATLANLIIGYDEAVVTVQTIEEEMTTWITDEEIRKVNERTRVANEDERIFKEEDRKLSESERKNAETVRIANEEQRIANEEARKSAEIIRQSNENIRIQIAEQRSAELTEAIDNANAVADNLQAKLDTGQYDGDSAYEIAVKNGFEGTEQEWLDYLKTGDHNHNYLYYTKEEIGDISEESANALVLEIFG